MLFKRADSWASLDGDYPNSITKRQFTNDQRQRAAGTGAAMPDGSFPIENGSDLSNAIRAIGRAKDPAKAKTHIRARAKALGMTDKLPDTWGKRDSGVAVLKFLASLDAKAGEIAKAYGEDQACDFDEAQALMDDSEAAGALMQKANEAVCALGTSLWSIQADDSISDKGEATQKSLDQFGDHVKTIVPEGAENAMVAGALLDAGYTINPLGGIELKKGADSMSMKAITKALGLEDSASEVAILAKLTETLEAATLNANIAKMSAKHKGFMDGGGKMPGGGKKAFGEMSADERDSHMKSNPMDDDEDDVEKAIKKGVAFRTEGGVILTKKDFGTDAGFQFAKQQATDNAILRADVQKGKEDADKTARIAKANTALVHIGKADDVGGLLHRVSKHDPKLADEVEALLKGANTLIEKGKLFEEIGAGHAIEGSATDLIQKGAEAIRKADPKITIEKARCQFREQNPEIKKREDEEAKAARQK